MLGKRAIQRPLASRARCQIRRSVQGGLLVGKLSRGSVEDTRARYLRSDQKGRNHGRNADESEELINGKHVCRPPKYLIAKRWTDSRRIARIKRMSEPDRHHLLSLARQNLI